MEWIAEQVMNLLDMINGSVLGALGCNMNTFIRYFPAAETMYGIFVGLGLGILLLNFIWQLFRNFGLGIGLEAEDPLKLTFRTILFMGLVFFSQDIVELVLKIGGTPYEWIVDASLPPIQFASFMSVITVVIGSTVGGSVSGKPGGIPNPAGAAAGAFSGGLAGMVSRKAAAGAATNLTSEKSGSGGFFGGLGNKMYESSVGETGGFASRVIGGVATGTASQNGVISGEKAVDAFQAYMGPMGGGIPSAAAEESDSFSGMQPTVTPETSIPTSPDGAAEPEPDMAPLPADNLQTGENQIPMSAEETGETAVPMDTGIEGYTDVMPDAPSDIPYSPESEGFSAADDFLEASFESPEVNQSAGIPAGMEPGSIGTVAGTEIPASAGEAIQGAASPESGSDTQNTLSGGTTILAAATVTPSGGGELLAMRQRSF